MRGATAVRVIVAALALGASMARAQDAPTHPHAAGADPQLARVLGALAQGSLDAALGEADRIAGRFQRRLGQGLAPGGRQRLDENLERCNRARYPHQRQRFGVDFAKEGERVLRPELQSGRAAGMEPSRRLACDLRLGCVEAESSEDCNNVRLGVEQAGFGGRPCPMPPRPGEHGGTRAHARRCDELVLGRIAAIRLPYLEQADVGSAPVAVPLHCCQQAGQQARPHR